MPRVPRTAATQVRRPHPAVAILVLERMGEIVAAEPIAWLARRTKPEALVVWITRAPYATLPASHPDVDAVLPVGCLAEWLLLRGLPVAARNHNRPDAQSRAVSDAD